MDVAGSSMIFARESMWEVDFLAAVGRDGELPVACGDVDVARRVDSGERGADLVAIVRHFVLDRHALPGHQPAYGGEHGGVSDALGEFGYHG
jgi:hypothetical protein